MNERVVAAALVWCAVKDFLSLKGGITDPLYRELVAGMGYVGATDELVTFFHSPMFELALDMLGIERGYVERVLPIPRREGCLCASCTGTDEAEPITPRWDESLDDTINRAVRVWSNSPSKIHRNS